LPSADFASDADRECLQAPVMRCAPARSAADIGQALGDSRQAAWELLLTSARIRVSSWDAAELV
jgi:hypothetical protein